MDTLLTNLSSPMSLFVTENEEIFTDGAPYADGRLARWMFNGTKLPSPVRFSDCSPCSGVFVDIINNLYCSQQNLHQVIRKTLSDPSNTLNIVAGTGGSGSNSQQLSFPAGIFVTIAFDLYVADCGNDRVQFFRSEEMYATTVPVNVSTGSMRLNCPSGVTLDADGYLFIVDQLNHRVVGPGPGGYRCVAGCSGSLGAGAYHLYYPVTMSFDSDGNIFVMDGNNGRIQKFLISFDLESECYKRSIPAMLCSKKLKAVLLTTIRC